MADKTGIEWTDATWNPIVGCSIVSPGCTNCYAMAQAARLLDRPGSHYEGTTRRVNGRPVWTGKVALAPDHILTQPLRWRRPRRIFVNSMGDPFHESVPNKLIDRVFAVAAMAPQHTLQVLTKRSARMLEYMTGLSLFAGERLANAAGDLGVDDDTQCAVANWINGWSRWRHAPPDANPLNGTVPRWPLPNVWCGVSAEDQARANERIPNLLATPAVIRFVSAEPLLGPIDLTNVVPPDRYEINALTGFDFDQGTACNPLDWVICGGESGPDARPMHPEWVRSLRDQCRTAAVPFFFKQWGEWLPDFEDPAIPFDDDSEQSRFPTCVWDPDRKAWERTNGCWDDSDKWTIATDYWQPAQSMTRIGKRRAGAQLEGEIIQQMPEPHR